MKKLTAGIFTVLLGLVAANSADAAVASKGYVDEMVGVNTTAIATLDSTVDGHTQSIADLTAADTAINAKIGDVAAGKTLAGMIADAKQEAIEAAGAATYDDREVRNLIAGKENSSNKVSAVSQDLSDGEKQQYYPSLYLTEDMIQSSTNNLMFEVNKINNSDVMNSGITKGKVDSYDTYAKAISDNATAAADAQLAAEAAQDAADANAVAIATINNSESGLLKQAETAANSYADDVAATAKSEAIAAAKSAGDAAYAAKSYEGRVQANETAIAAINNSESGLLKQAETAANSYADDVAATAKSEAITAANEYTDAEVKKVDDKLANYALNSTIGEVESGKTVVQMISDAKTAATYDDTAVKDLIATNKTATETNAAAIKTINEGAVMNSGISADKVSAYDAYAGTIAANKTATETNAALIAANTAAAADAQADADAAQQTADKAIPKPSGECADPDNKCVLTFNNAQYAWEVIERNGDGE